MMLLRMMLYLVGLQSSPTYRSWVTPTSSPDAVVERQLFCFAGCSHGAAFSRLSPAITSLKSHLWKSHNSTDRVIGEMSVVINIALLARATLTW